MRRSRLGRKDAIEWSRLRTFRRKVDRARLLVEQAFRLNDSWYVALSGGKDSTCVLDLVRDHRPDTAAQFSAREWDLPETVEYLRSIANLRKTGYLSQDAEYEWAQRWSSKEVAREMWPDIIWVDNHQQISQISENGVFLGLRSDEARHRKIHIASQGPLFQAERDGKWRCNPISWWNVMDVWAYIVARDLPYNRAYDVMDRAGIPLEEQRVGPFAYALSGGSATILKRCWPEWLNRYAAAHPEVRAYV